MGWKCSEESIMRVYLAARYSRKNEISKLVPVFGTHGLSVCSRWLRETESPDCKLSDFSPEVCRNFAEVDWEDIEACDTFVFFSEDPLVGTPRGGRHVELGLALGLGKRVVVIGKHENIFHFLPCVTVYESLDKFLEKEKQNVPTSD
jgi:nucleoside 2-deoxyribosyltransferase